MTHEEPGGAGRSLAFYGLLVLGALAWYGLPRKAPERPAAPARPQDLTEVRTAADRLRRASAPPPDAAWDDFDDEPAPAKPRPAPSGRAAAVARAPGMLPDAIFARPGRDAAPLHAPIAQVLERPTARYFALDAASGAFVFDEKQGWLSFDGEAWLAQDARHLPEDLRARFPLPEQPRTGAPMPFAPRDGLEPRE